MRSRRSLVGDCVRRESARLRTTPASCCVVAAIAMLLVLPQTAVARTTRERILGLAEQQLGYHDHGDYCTMFGRCETWCSLFVTWVWERAGVPVPSLAFTGYLYDWAKATTAVQGPHAVPQPGDAVLFGTGPLSVSTSRHVGIVEAVYPGYLVTIEGDSLHAVRRYVVPLRNPELVGEPGPIYAYASPLAGNGARGSSAGSAEVAHFAALPPAVIARQQSVRRPSLEQRRLLRAIAALRAFQHMPYRTANVSINWTGVDSHGLVEVLVRSAMPVSYAASAWQGFLRRYDDAGHAYSVSFQAPTGAPVDSTAPSISGSASPGQVLTESHGVWSNSPTTYFYQWEDCDSSGQSCLAITGATSQTYAPTPTDVGYTIRVQETARNADGAGQPATSAATAVVVAP